MDSEGREIKASIENVFVESGYRDKLKELLMQRLLDSGWADHLKVRCREMIEQRNGISQISVDSLVLELTHVARVSVPEAIKNEIFTEIQEFLQAELEKYVSK